MPTLYCKQITYQGIDRVSKESCRGIDALRFSEGQLGLPPQQKSKSKSLATGFAMKSLLTMELS